MNLKYILLSVLIVVAYITMFQMFITSYYSIKNSELALEACPLLTFPRQEYNATVFNECIKYFKNAGRMITDVEYNFCDNKAKYLHYYNYTTGRYLSNGSFECWELHGSIEWSTCKDCLDNSVCCQDVILNRELNKYKLFTYDEIKSVLE